MVASIQKLWRAAVASLWLVPAASALLAAGAAFGLMHIDRMVAPRWIRGLPWIFGAGTDGAREVLSTVAGSVITITGVTFSITVVALALASQQYTPRVLRQFTSDRGNQVVLGGFIGTFVYCLLVLRSVRAESEHAGNFVPHFSVTGAVVLSMVSVGLLIFFIHHITLAIRPDFIMARLADETREWIDKLFPEPLGHDSEEAGEADVASHLPPEPGQTVAARSTGHLQGLDADALMRFASEKDLLIRIEPRIGDFVAPGDPLATVWPRDRCSDEQAASIRSCFATDPERSLDHDPEFGVLQIVDIAVKALSPSINDPTTAGVAVAYLGAIVREMGDRRLPSPLRRDDQGALRVVARGADFQKLANLAFDQIRQHGAQDVAVTIRMLEVIRDTAPHVTTPPRREVLRRQVKLILEGAETKIPIAADRESIIRQGAAALEALANTTESAECGAESE